MARVLVAVPTFENISPDTFKSLWDMDKPTEHSFIFESMRGYDTASARNNIAELAMDSGADYAMMVDSDVIVPHDAFTLLYSHGVDVCMGYYMHRDRRTNDTTPKTNVCKLADDDGAPFFGYPAESQMTGDELRGKRENGEHLIEIHGGGMGCVLIATRVFREAPYPWFDWVNYTAEKRSLLSEDLFFCETMHNECIPIYVDTRVACGHIMRRAEYV